MKKVTLLDTSVATDNLGDEIIMDAVKAAVFEVIPDAYPYHVQTHDLIGRRSRKLLEQSDHIFVGGTNILSSRMLARGALWRIMPQDLMGGPTFTLLATGWRGYMGDLNWSTRKFLEKRLCSEAIHSVRDSYAENKLEKLGKKVVNTACVTMWELTPDVCAALPTHKAKNAVTTLTFYDADREGDIKMLETLKREYENVYFWPQQMQDMAYLQTLGITGLKFVAPQTSAYNALLDSEDVDFVGTRLHGGIRAMQRGHRALIVAIDNRAKEIARDTGLPIIERGQESMIEAWIHSNAPTDIRLPVEAIEAWKRQFH